MSLEKANQKKFDAERTRSEWIASLYSGVLSVPDLLQAAAGRGPDAAALRRISLRRLLTAQPDWGSARATRVLDHLSGLFGVPEERRLNVAWLIDARTDGRRLHAFADALHPRGTPWPGFPLAPEPTRGDHGHG